MLDVNQLAHFATSSLGLALALLMIGVIIWVLRRLGYGGPVEPTGFVERMFGHDEPGNCEELVNPSFIDGKGQSIDFGSFIEVTMHNGHGRKYRLEGGSFCGCNPKNIKAGARVEVGYQHGAFSEKLKVRYNRTEQHLYIQSKLTMAEILNRIEGGDEAGA